MAISMILAALIAMLLAAGLYLAIKAFAKKEKRAGMAAGIFAVVMAVALALVPLSFRTVDTGEVAVVKHLGRARDIRTAGTHFDFWLTNPYQKYAVKVQNVEILTSAYSSDAQTMDIQMTLQYQIMADHVIDIANQYGSLEILQNRIQSIATEKTKAVLSSHKAMNIIADRASMSPAVESAIKDAVGDEYYVNVTAVVLTNIDFSDAFELAVEEKMIAEQKQLKAEYENQTKVAQAEADAKAKLIEAEAQAQANELLEKSLTDKILQEKYIEKWNGELPGVVAGEDAASILIPSQASDAAGAE